MATPPFDPYEELGLSSHAVAEPELIKAAFKALAKKYHPDNHPPGSTEKARAEEKMARLNEAQHLLLSGHAPPPASFRPTSGHQELAPVPPTPFSPPTPPPSPPFQTRPPRSIPMMPIAVAAALLLLVLFLPQYLNSRHRHQAKILLDQGQLQAALLKANQAIEANPRDGASYLLRATIQHQLHHPELAEVDLSNARGLVSDNAWQKVKLELSPTPAQPGPSASPTLPTGPNLK